MAQYRTAQGRTIDMSRLAAKNEKTRAVGNMRVNARGDTIDGMGRVIEPATAKVTNQYAKTVSNQTGRPVNTNVQSNNKVEADPIVEEKLESEEDFNDQEDIEIEQIKQQENKKGKK